VDFRIPDENFAMQNSRLAFTPHPCGAFISCRMAFQGKNELRHHAEKVRYHKEQEGGVRTMCRIVEDYAKERAAEARKIALAEGLKRGLKRGVQENAIANAKNLLIETDLSPEKIAKCCSLPLEQVLALKEELETEITVK